ncbi:MAG: WD40 repeat domain-containing protein [Candidatus Tectimicrobiota bacterium]
MPRVKSTPRLPCTVRERWRSASSDHVIALAWSSDGTYLAAAAVSGPLLLLEGQSGQTMARLAGHALGTTSLSWAPTRPLLASAGQDGLVRLWDGPAGQPQEVLEAGATWVERVAWSPDGAYLAAAAGRYVRCWDAAGTLRHTSPAQSSTVSDMQWAPRQAWINGTLPVLASTAYGGVSLWRPDTPEPLAQYTWQGSILVLAWSPHGRYLVHGDQDGTVHFWHLATRKDARMTGYSTKVRELAWDASGRFLATGGGPVVVIWDFAGKGPQGSRPLMLEAHQQFLSTLAFQHAGPLLASGGRDGRLALWQPGAQKKALALQQLSSGVTQTVWSPDDRLLAVGTEDGGVIVYEVAR